MNRNNEAHFNAIPKIDISRSRFKRDQDIKLTFNAGELVPFFVDEVLPGDTFSVDTAGIIRQTTPIFPVMDNAYLDTYYFFVPNRIVWDHWKEFMGENKTGPWIPETQYSVPVLAINSTGKAGDLVPYPQSILDYMGVPTLIPGTDATGQMAQSIYINALPIRGYVMIWNEWFRDQNWDNPAIFKTDDSNTDYADSGTYNPETGDIADVNIETRLQQALNGGRCLPVNKFHDRFTSTLPSPQKNESALIPLNGNARILPYTDKELTEEQEKGVYIKTTNTLGVMASEGQNASIPGTYMVGASSLNGSDLNTAYLGADLSTVTGATINQLRQAFQVQRLWERDARGGSRYRELINSHFGVTISDKTVQIPEYLGGARITINMNQVVQTSGTTETSPQGNASAISVTPFNKSSFTKSFEEHGFVIGVMCVRHDRSYQQGLEPFWSRGSNRLDYYFPVLANLGEQPVFKRELYLQAGENYNENVKVFGYQEAWSDYRMKPNRICGQMRSNNKVTLDAWHYADYYTQVPSMGQEWLKEGDTEIQRTLAVDNEPQFFGDILVRNTTTRAMPVYSVPGLIDHH